MKDSIQSLRKELDALAHQVAVLTQSLAHAGLLLPETKKEPQAKPPQKKGAAKAKKKSELNPAQKAWVTRRRLQAELEKLSPAKKAWITRKKLAAARNQ